MAKAKKVYTVRITSGGFVSRPPRETFGTLEELIQYFGYTLETGKSYEREKGNYKINTNPKSLNYYYIIFVNIHFNFSLLNFHFKK